jgi:hypothetical protein
MGSCLTCCDNKVIQEIVPPIKEVDTTPILTSREFHSVDTESSTVCGLCSG